MARDKVADVILRIGLAFAFLYPALDAIVEPYAWIGYFPPFMRGIVPDLVLLHAFGAFEIIIALWILSGWRVFYPTALALVMLVAIVCFNMADFQILFRDLAIASIALSILVSGTAKL